MDISEFYQIFGQIVLILGILIIFLLFMTVILGRILIKEERLIFPKFLLFTMDMFYGLFKKFSGNLGVDKKIVDQIGVEVRNKVNEKLFWKVKPPDKIIVLPHCLRHADCEATLESSGLVCKNCHRCVIGMLKDKGEYMGYQVFIIPGSSFLKNIVGKHEFKAVLGVACYQDLNLAMMKLSKFPSQGVPLLRDGCINTEVDASMILEKMGVELGKPKKLSENNSCNQESFRRDSL